MWRQQTCREGCKKLGSLLVERLQSHSGCGSFTEAVHQARDAGRRAFSQTFTGDVLKGSNFSAPVRLQAYTPLHQGTCQLSQAQRTPGRWKSSWSPVWAQQGVRWQSTAGKPEAAVRDAQHRLSQLVSGPSSAAQSARQRASDASQAVYSKMPAQARHLIESASRPGSLQKVIKLQAEAFWHSHGRKVMAIGGVFVVYALWRTLFGVTSLFLNLSETMAEFGFLALAVAVASFGYLYLRRLYSINPDSVYRLAMLQLNTNPGVLEVMGAPVAGSSVRATVLTGGGLRLKGLTPRLRSRRMQMIFPLTGSERRGLVSLEAKKLKGRYLFKLLAVDVPSAAGQEQRLFLEGDQKAYERGGVMRELRDPFLQALSLREDNEAQDEMDDAAEAALVAQERRAKEAAKSQRAPKPLDQGGGMFFYERAYWAVRRLMGPPAKSAPAAKQDAATSPAQPAPATNQNAAAGGPVSAAPALSVEQQEPRSLGATAGSAKAAS